LGRLPLTGAGKLVTARTDLQRDDLAVPLEAGERVRQSAAPVTGSRSPDGAHVRIKNQPFVSGDQMQVMDARSGGQETVHGIRMKRLRQGVGLFDDVETYRQTLPA